MLFLKSPFSDAWKDKDPFDEIQTLRGKTCRKVTTRSTSNFSFNGESYYIKVHHGTSLKEIFKNIITLKMPVLGARNEFNAINRLHQLGISTMETFAFGETGLNPLRRKSFIITKDLNPAISLEDYCSNWKNDPPPYFVKKSIILEVARMVRLMHEGGVNHRDCYICHFLLHLPYNTIAQPTLSIIDLHRAQIRSKVPLRWRNKDLIALYFSSMNLGLSKKDYFLFLKEYFNNEKLKTIFQKEKDFFRSIKSKASKIAERTIRKSL